jgi:hypothetical protein
MGLIPPSPPPFSISTIPNSITTAGFHASAEDDSEVQFKHKDAMNRFVSHITSTTKSVYAGAFALFYTSNQLHSLQTIPSTTFSLLVWNSMSFDAKDN